MEHIHHALYEVTSGTPAAQSQLMQQVCPLDSLIILSVLVVYLEAGCTESNHKGIHSEVHGVIIVLETFLRC